MVNKNVKNIKTATTCFGSRRNHPQGANSTKLKLQIWFDGACPYECGQYYGGIFGPVVRAYAGTILREQTVPS